MVQNQHRCQGQGSDQPVLPGAVYQGLRQALGGDGLCCVGGAAGHIVDGGGIQRKTNGEHHGAGDHGRKQQPDLLDKEPHDNGDNAAHDHGAGNGCHAATAGGNGLHTGHVGEADAQNDRQAGAEAPANGIELQQRGHGRHDQRCLNQQNLIRQGQSDSAGDHDGGRDTAHDHGYQMLQCQGDRGANGRDAVELEQKFPAVSGAIHSQDSFRAGKIMRFSYRLILS